MSGLAHESQCLKGVAKSAAVVDGEEVWKIMIVDGEVWIVEDIWRRIIGAGN